jgi:hypothetical protein
MKALARYRLEERPLWSTFARRNELLAALHEHCAMRFLVGTFAATPFVCWYFRLLGTRIGRRVSKASPPSRGNGATVGKCLGHPLSTAPRAW